MCKGILTPEQLKRAYRLHEAHFNIGTLARLFKLSNMEIKAELKRCVNQQSIKSGTYTG